MQLLHSRAAPGPEFASVSLLSKEDVAGEKLSCRVEESLLLPSPLSTITRSTCLGAVRELHHRINSILNRSRSNKETSKMAIALLKEDERLLDDVQVFRPLKGNGIGLHYRVIRDKTMMRKLIPLVSQASKATTPESKGLENDVTGVVFCIGVAGMPSAFVMSPLHHSLSQRLGDCIGIICKTANVESEACKSLLTTLLLTEDEDRITNTMAEGYKKTVLSEISPQIKNNRSKKQNQDIMPEDHYYGMDLDSADQARIMVERLAVLSVAENDTMFRKFESKASKKAGKRLRKTGRDADLDGFDFKGERKSIREDAASLLSDKSTSKSSISSGLLKQSKGDTKSRMPGKFSQGSVPALNASKKDGRSRRASVDNAPYGEGPVPALPSSRRDGRSRRASVDNHPSRQGSIPAHTAPRKDGRSRRASVELDPSGSVGAGRHRNRHGNFDPFGSNPSSSADTTADTTTTSDNSLSTHQARYSDLHFGGDAFNGPNDMTLAMQMSANSLEHDSGNGHARLLVSLALNEDLTCVYKHSKISSCSVEGVVQVQVKSNTEQNIPFFLLLRDPSRHLQVVQENKKYAENMSESLLQERPSTRPDFKYTVSVPKTENYVPLLRYTCGSELRPVPIRVQTRVRSEDAYWRVALQISSNPNNKDSLTDLTIIMGVPTVVKGESLTTSPAGGVWNASKRSVIWCVSELGGGEKFQLQARFETYPDAGETADEKPKFPVLVRCQCMYTQLSDVEIEALDIPEVFPVDVKVKKTRRFRLSHRERP